jgi:ParB-like chromosome segregation protein Spo0J
VKISAKRRDFDERKIVFLRPCELKLNPRNARVHPKTQISQIACSIERFGFNNPVLIDDQNNVLAGEGRVRAARLLGLERVPPFESNISAQPKNGRSSLLTTSWPKRRAGLRKF